MKRSLCLPFSPSYPYPTHISRYIMFPNFRSLEALPKSACSLSYEDFKPRYLDQHTILENPVSLSKPSLPLAVKHEESGILLHRLCHQEACLPAWRPEDGPREITLPEWIPSSHTTMHPAQITHSPVLAQSADNQQQLRVVPLPHERTRRQKRFPPSPMRQFRHRALRSRPHGPGAPPPPGRDSRRVTAQAPPTASC
ncbi:uncharacterized protein VK521_000524 [Ammospiza maritima maritima]